MPKGNSIDDFISLIQSGQKTLNSPKPGGELNKPFRTVAFLNFFQIFGPFCFLLYPNDIVAQFSSLFHIFCQNYAIFEGF